MISQVYAEELFPDLLEPEETPQREYEEEPTVDEPVTVVAVEEPPDFREGDQYEL